MAKQVNAFEIYYLNQGFNKINFYPSVLKEKQKWLLSLVKFFAGYLTDFIGNS